MGETKQKGFGIVLILVVVAVLAIAGVVGWSVYTGKKAQNNSIVQSTSQDPLHINTIKVMNPDQSVDYFEIKELGIKIKLDDKTRDLTYRYSVTDPNGDAAIIFSQTMKNIELASKYCGGNNLGLIGIIARSKDPYYFSMGIKAIVVDNVTSFKLGDYYYEFAPPQSGCSQDTIIEQRRDANRRDFVNVLKTIKPTIN